MEGLHPPGTFTSNEKRILSSIPSRKQHHSGDWPVYSHFSTAYRKLHNNKHACPPSPTEQKGRQCEVWTAPRAIRRILLLAACGSVPPQHPTKVTEQKSELSGGRIEVGERLGTSRMIRYSRPAYPKEAKKATLKVRWLWTL